MHKTYVILLGKYLRKKMIQNTDWMLTGLYFLLLELFSITISFLGNIFLARMCFQDLYKTSSMLL